MEDVWEMFPNAFPSTPFEILRIVLLHAANEAGAQEHPPSDLSEEVNRGLNARCCWHISRRRQLREHVEGDDEHDRQGRALNPHL